MASKAWGNPHVATLTHFLDLFLNALTKSTKMQGTKEPPPQVTCAPATIIIHMFISSKV